MRGPCQTTVTSNFLLEAWRPACAWGENKTLPHPVSYFVGGVWDSGVDPTGLEMETKMQNPGTFWAPSQSTSNGRFMLVLAVVFYTVEKNYVSQLQEICASGTCRSHFELLILKTIPRNITLAGCLLIWVTDGPKPCFSPIGSNSTLRTLVPETFGLCHFRAFTTQDV